MAKITAIIPTYNRAELLRDCLVSVLSQVRKPDEIIVVNDGSTDGTESVVASFGEDVRLLSKDNGGKSLALNAGLEVATGDYIWIMDDDDLVAPDGLANLENIASANPAADFVFGDYEIFQDGDLSNRFRPHYRSRPEEPNVKIAFLEGMFTVQPAMLVRKRAYDLVGRFDPFYIRSQDYEMTLRLVKDVATASTSDIIFYQRQHLGLRGAAADRFEASKSVAKWIEYEKRLFNWASKAFSLAELTPTFALTWTEPLRMRAAHIQRAAIMSKRGLWASVIDDIKQAIALSEKPLAPEEVHILEIMAQNEHVWQELAESSGHILQLRRMRNDSAVGRQIIVALSRPLVWQSRKMLTGSRYSDVFRTVGLMHSVLGTGGIVQRVLSR